MSFRSMASSLLANHRNKASDTIISRTDFLILVLISILSIGAGAGIAKFTSSNGQNYNYSSNNLYGQSDLSLSDSISLKLAALQDNLDEQKQINLKYKNYLNTRAYASGTADTKITVNNQEIPVPENGSVKQTIPTENGNVEINVESSNQQSSSGSSSNISSNSTNIEIESNSSSYSETELNEEVRIRQD